MVRNTIYPKLIKVYRIDNDIEPETFYIGSTSKPYLSQRMAHHKTCARKGDTRKLYTFMNSIGIDHFEITLVDARDVSSWEEQLRFEREYVDQLKPSLNSRAPIISSEERKQHGINYNSKELSKQKRKEYKAKPEVRERERKNEKARLHHDKASGKYHCDECDIDFDRKLRYTDHMNSFSHYKNALPVGYNDFEFRCDICKIYFTLNTNLKRHHKSSH
jgi:hypothetical protein